MFVVRIGIEINGNYKIRGFIVSGFIVMSECDKYISIFFKILYYNAFFLFVLNSTIFYSIDFFVIVFGLICFVLFCERYEMNEWILR